MWPHPSPLEQRMTSTTSISVLRYSCFTITTRFGTCCTRISRLRQGSLLVLLENDDYNKDRYLLYSCSTITTMFGTCCPRLSRLQQGSVLVVLVKYDYNKVQYLSYLLTVSQVRYLSYSILLVTSTVLVIRCSVFYCFLEMMS